MKRDELYIEILVVRPVVAHENAHYSEIHEHLFLCPKKKVPLPYAEHIYFEYRTLEKWLLQHFDLKF